MMTTESQETLETLERGIAGDQQALSDLWDRYRERLRRLLKLRMDIIGKVIRREAERLATSVGLNAG